MGKNPLVNKGGSRASNMFWERSASSKSEKSKSNNCGAYRPYFCVLRTGSDRKMLKTLTVYQTVAVGSGRKSQKPMEHDCDPIPVASIFVIVQMGPGGFKTRRGGVIR